MPDLRTAAVCDRRCGTIARESVSTLGNYYGNDAASTYNAFEVKAEKRFSQGLQFLTHYTFSHADNYDSNYYVDQPPIAWGPVDFDRNHVFVFNTVYELPFGKGKQYLGNSSKAMDYLIGGWQLSNTTNWSSGLPWTPSFNECGTQEDVGVCRPNKGSGSFSTGPGSLTIFPTDSRWCHSSLRSRRLSLVAPVVLLLILVRGTLGTSGEIHSADPLRFYSDLSVSKNFLITERFKAQFRMDAFNVFNHPVYAFSANNGASTCIDCTNGTNGTNGFITSLEGGSTMRELQFALRFDF